MRIEDLDEFQGLTADMVREWLHKLDPSIKPGASLAEDIQAVSDLSGETPQALLREINPRMRPWPSEDAQEAHLGPWLCQTNGSIIAGVFESSSFVYMSNQVTYGMCKELAEHELFWPCDEYGSKVRWPTDAEGRML